jgi:hypothetical protein
MGVACKHGPVWVREHPMTEVSAEPTVSNSSVRQLQAILDLLSIANEADAAKRENREKVLQHFYRILDVLDSKTSHLLRFNAIIMTALVFLASTMFRVPTTPLALRVFLLLTVLVPLLGTARAMHVFRVEGDSFLRWRKADVPIKPEDLEARILNEFKDLSAICDKRCQEHRWVWTSTWCSVGLLALSVFWVVLVLICGGADGVKP